MLAQARPEIARVAEESVLNLKELEMRLDVLRSDLATLCSVLGHAQAAQVAITPARLVPTLGLGIGPANTLNTPWGTQGHLGLGISPYANGISPYANLGISPFGNVGTPYGNISPYASLGTPYGSFGSPYGSIGTPYGAPYHTGFGGVTPFGANVYGSPLSGYGQVPFSGIGGLGAGISPLASGFGGNFAGPIGAFR